MDKINCEKCGKADAFPCDSCKRLLCSGCAELTASEVKCLLLKGKRKLIFLCPECETGFWKVPILIKEITELKGQIEELKKNYLVNIDKNQEQSVTCGESEEVINEIAERQRRASNIIVYNINESSVKNKTARITDECNKIKELLSGIDEVNKNEIRVFRVGKYDSNKARPLKVVLANKEEAMKILKNKQKIIAENPNIRIYSDQTKKQREYYKATKAKLEAIIANGDESKTIKFINNIPTIVKKMQPKN